MKLKTSDLANARQDLSLRPVLGLRYGRWRLGHATGDEWLAFSGYRKEANLAYQLRDDERLKVDLSLRIQNLEDNSSFDGFSSGKNTLRARVGANYALNKRWSVGTDVTQDLMGRGDGTTLSLGASYGLPLSERSNISLSAGVNWGTASHWATQMRLLPPPPGGWHAGLGSVGLGMGYRYALTPQWAWFGTVGSLRHLGQVDTVNPSALSWSGQIGVLYFSP
jgi:outer membrane scaffolding protein for murein synthesis (MipA/OmpV family)